MFAKSLSMGDVKEMETTTKQNKSVLIPVVIATVIQKRDPPASSQHLKDITLTKIIKLAKGLLMEDVVETSTTSTPRRLVLKPARLNQ